MTFRFFSNRNTTPLALALLACMVAAPPALAQTTDAAVQRCRQLGDAGPRLACYDAIAAGLAAQPGAKTVAGQSPAASLFGMEQRSAALEPDLMDSRIQGPFSGWSPKEMITLANGQVWQINDDSRASLKDMVNPAIRIRRGAMGAFYLEIEGSNRTPKVKRLQ